MLCDSCKERDAVVHLTRIVDDQVTLLHLCDACAALKGVETTVALPQHPLGDILQAVQQASAASETTRDDAAVCSFCGATVRDFRASGRLGCAHCYDAFETSLRELLRRLHGGHRHVGSVYVPPHPEAIEQADVIGELRSRLQRAVDSEQFELAAELRDRIKVLE
jgi:protein arginine kinase activator